MTLISTTAIHTYVDLINYIGFTYLQPPPLIPNHVHRQILMDEIATKLLQATIDPNKYETTLIITGAGGFGKTTTVISLCYYPVVNKHFTDGFVFIKLGPQATDPSIKLMQVCYLLTGELTDKQCDIIDVEQKITQVTSDYYNNLLVIIDDVWHVEDAEPIVKALSNCKTILTTRMNDIEQYIPSKQSVNIGPMTQLEAITLLTSGVIDSSKLSEEDVSLLDELAQDVHLWPLLLSLIRGQLSHYVKRCYLSDHNAIHNVQAKLYHKSLTAFDRKNTGAINKCRISAVKDCIEMTLELLTKSLSDKLKSLILYTGIGTSLQKAVLNNLWNISKREAEETVDVLWAYGLVHFTNITISPNNITQLCVEVHAVISQYIIECMDSTEVFSLSPSGRLSTLNSVIDGLTLVFQQLYGVYVSLSSTTVMDYLKYKLSELEHLYLPLCLQAINRYTVTDPHIIIVMLQLVEDALMISPHTINLLSLIDGEIRLLKSDCKQIIRGMRKLCRKLNQRAQRNLYERNYDELLQNVEEFIKCYPLHQIVLIAVTIINKIIPYCYGELLDYMTRMYERLMMLTADYHDLTLSLLPHIKLYIRLHKQIIRSLLKGSPGSEMTYRYIISGKFSDEIDLINIKKSLKLKEVASSLVSMISFL